MQVSPGFSILPHWFISQSTYPYCPTSITVAMLLMLLSRFSHVRLCPTQETAAHQAPPSLGFSRQEHWSGLPFPSPMRESESELAQSCPTLSDPMDCSPPGSSVHGIFQARVLEWGATPSSRDLSSPGIRRRSPSLQADSVPSKPPCICMAESLHLIGYSPIQNVFGVK